MLGTNQPLYFVTSFMDEIFPERYFGSEPPWHPTTTEQIPGWWQSSPCVIRVCSKGWIGYRFNSRTNRVPTRFYSSTNPMPNTKPLLWLLQLFQNNFQHVFQSSALPGKFVPKWPWNRLFQFLLGMVNPITCNWGHEQHSELSMYASYRMDM